MDVYSVIGVQFNEYVSKRDGLKKSGYNLFVTYQDSRVQGLACDRLWIRPQLLQGLDLKPNDKIAISYNRYGSIESLEKSY